MAQNNGTPGQASWRLEAQHAAGELLGQYDREIDAWTMPRRGRLWDAVAHASQAGRLGQGVTIAMIDGPIDPSIGRLSKRVERLAVAPAAADEPTLHGTAIALLIRTVAPKADLQVYEVFLFGKPHLPSVSAALEMVAHSNADIVNLSVGLSRSLGLPDAMQDDHCDLCVAARRVTGASKILVAAAGNRSDSIYCPARDTSVLACGFQEVSRQLAADGMEYAKPHLSTKFSHSLAADFTLDQEPGALGTSFAAPLVSGFLALMRDPGELQAFIQSSRMAAEAETFHQWAMDGSTTLHAMAQRAFANALKVQPHDHRPQPPVDPCPECTMFSEDLFVNYAASLLQLSVGRLSSKVESTELAEKLLHTTLLFAPRSPHAHSLLGWLRYQQGRTVLVTDGVTPDAADLLNRGLHYMERAIALRRDFAGYAGLAREISEVLDRTLETLDTMVHLGDLLHEGASRRSIEACEDALLLVKGLHPKAIPEGLRRRIQDFIGELTEAGNPHYPQLNERFDLAAYAELWCE